MKEKVCFIINPVSGSHGKLKGKLKEWIERYVASHFEFEIFYTEYAGHARVIVREAVEKHACDIVAIAGGDGSIHEILPELVFQDIVLLILPMGSGNGLARHLRYPMNPKKILKQMHRYKTERIDTGKANGRYFASIAGLGFDGFIAKSFTGSKRRGFWGYSYRILKHLIFYRPFRYNLSCQSVQIKGSAFMITFFNSDQYGYNMRLANDASIRDGLIDAYVVNDFPRILMPVYLLAILFGWHRWFSNIHRLRADEYELIAQRPVDFQMDGESFGKSKMVKIEAVPQSLKIRIPK